jgi:hypothetical protein
MTVIKLFHFNTPNERNEFRIDLKLTLDKYKYTLINEELNIYGVGKRQGWFDDSIYKNSSINKFFNDNVQLNYKLARFVTIDIGTNLLYYENSGDNEFIYNAIDRYYVNILTNKNAQSLFNIRHENKLNTEEELIEVINTMIEKGEIIIREYKANILVHYNEGEYTEDYDYDYDYDYDNKLDNYESR